MDPIKENAMVEGCIQGNRSAQYAFYKQYAKAMYNISYRITNNPDDAEDVLQEAFLSAFNNMHNFKGESSVGAWLKRIVINAAINNLKKQRVLYEPLKNEDIELDKDEISDEQLVLELDRIRGAIHMLPDGFRTVFSLYLLEGYDHKEIAGILGITESTSKSQYNRAKKKLKEILKERIYVDG